MTSFPRSTHRARRLLLLIGALVLVAATTQCRMVTDNVLRPRVDVAGAGACIAACSKAANEALNAESQLHQERVRLCGVDPVCKAEEEARHEAAVAAIQNQRKACQDGCHHQGGGRGGR